jgi:hypothetical protein
MIVREYDVDEVVHYYCECCGLEGKLNLSSVVSDNCAIEVDVRCASCREAYVLFVIKCKDEALADDLNARLNVLKSNRFVGGIENGNKESEERSDNRIQTEDTTPCIIGIGESVDGLY